MNTLTTYVVVDLEATGVTTGHLGHIIQIGVTFIENYKITDTLSFLVKPPVSISKPVSDLTGITNETVKEAPYFEEIAEYMYTLLQGCVFVGHNVFFDYNLLKEEFNRVNIFDFQCDTIDTIDLTEIIYPYEKKLNLKYLVDSKQINRYMNNFVEHQADSDALATAHLFLLLLKNMSQIEQVIRYKIATILKYKKNILYTLFEKTVVIHDYEMFSNRQIEDKAIVELNRLENDDTQHRIVYQSNCDFSTHINQGKTVIICQTEERLQQIVNRYQPVKPIYHAQYFYYPDNIEFVMNHLDDLSDKEIKQFCSFLVWQSITETNFLGQLKLSAKLNYYLSYRVNTHDVFQQQLSDIQQDIVVMTMQTYLEHELYLHAQLQYAQVIFEQIDETYASIVQHFKKEIDISFLIMTLHYLKQKFSENVVHSDLTKLYRVLTQLFDSYPDLKDKIDAVEDMQILFVDQLTDSLLEMFNSVAAIVENILSSPEKYRKLSTKILQKMTAMVSHLKFIKTELTAQDYVTLKVKRSGHTHQFVFIVNKSYLNEWFLKQIIEANRQVTFLTTIPLTTDLMDYYKQIFGFKQLNYLSTVNQEIEKVSWHYVANQVDVLNYKEMLIVKRVIKFLKLLKGHTLILVSSTLYSDKLVETDSTCCYMKYFTPKLAESTEKINVVLTYEQLLKTMYNFELFDNVVLIKLPFDPPKYEESKNIDFSKMKFFNYFEKITLPKMIVKMKRIERICRNKKLYVLDNRVEQSSYAKKILNNLAIVKIDVETIDF